jgi:hypothetical protein
MRRWAGSVATGLAIAASLSACHARKAPPASPDTLARLSQATGITWPRDTRVLAEDADARAAAEGAGLWIAFAAGPFTLPGDKVNVSSDTVRRVVQAQLPADDLGENLAGEAPSYEWASGGSRWRGAELATSRGSYLVLDRSKL